MEESDLILSLGCIGREGTVALAVCAGTAALLLFTSLQAEEQHGGHLGSREALHGCLQMSGVFVDPCLISEIDESSQNSTHN